MTIDDFNEARERMRDARKGIVKPSIYFKNQFTGRPFSLNQKMHFGMGTYMCMTGPPGTGKTAFIDTEFLLNPILDHMNNPQQYADIYCIYRSMERSSVDKMAKWICYLIYLGTEGKVLMDEATFFQHHSKKRLLTDHDLALVDALEDYIKEISKSIDLVTDTDSPEGIKQYLTKTLYRMGSYITTDLDKIYRNGEIMKTKILENDVPIDKKFDMIDEQGRPYTILRFPSTGKEVKVSPGFSRFYPKKKDQIIMTINDTVDVIKILPKKNETDTTAEHADNMRQFRKDGALAIIDIKQFGKESEKDFKSSSNHSLTVNQADIKGSHSIAQNADICLSILDPARYNITQWGGHPNGDWEGYNLERFHETFRLLQIFKNSGNGNLYKMPCIFIGEIGFFNQIPEPRYINETDYQEINRKFLSHLNPPEETKQKELFDNNKFKIKKGGEDTEAPF